MEGAAVRGFPPGAVRGCAIGCRRTVRPPSFLAPFRETARKSQRFVVALFWHCGCCPGEPAALAGEGAVPNANVRPRKGAYTGFKYALRWADGDDAGEAEYPDGSVQVGEQIRIDGNRLVRVRAVIPVELAAEFVDGAVYSTTRSTPVT